MKKMLLATLVLLGCTDPKTKITDRQKEILKQKSIVDKELETTKDSAMPTPAQLKEWDSLYTAENALDSEYDSLQKELLKLKK